MGDGIGPGVDTWAAVRHFMPFPNDRRRPASSLFEPVLINGQGFIATGEYEDGRRWGLQPLLFGRCLLGVWRPDETPTGMHDDVWEFPNSIVAAFAAHGWGGIDVEPRWWDRHPSSGRRRAYDQDGSFVETVDGD